MTNPELPSEEELLAGRMKDGSSPPLYSGELYEPWKKPLPGIDETKSASELTAEELHVRIDRQMLDDLDESRDFLRLCVAAGREILFELEPAGSSQSTRSSEEQQNNNQQADNPACQRRGSQAAENNNQPAHAEGISPACQRGASEAIANDNGPANTKAKPAPPRGSNPSPTIPDLPEPRLPGLRSLGPTKRQGGPGVKLPDPPQETEPEQVERMHRMASEMNEAMRAVTGEKGSGSRRVPDPFSPESQKVSGTVPEPDTFCDLPKRRVNRKVSPGQILALAERAAVALAKVSELRAKVAHRLVDRCTVADTKTSFMWDRAHGVVAATLLHMDESWDKLGFGAYMPFRYPDQWLMFCGVMQRVLAANGLIHSKNADVYRRLLEETPPVEWPEGIEILQDRIKKLRVPENWSLCWRNRGANTMDDLKERLEKEVWNVRPPP